MIKKMFLIAIDDYKKGGDFFRIFKKSWARYKKHGFSGMKSRLEKEWVKLNSYKKRRDFDFGFDKYRKWIEKYEKEDIEELKYTPLISVIMPVYNTELRFLKRAVESVLNQSYENFELCISDDNSSKKEVVEYLKTLKDKRIKINFSPSNKGISENLNAALNMANGEWVVFLDHDDMFSKNALFEVARKINENKKLKLIYSDEDKIDENGRRFEPYFKSDWNKELFLSHNYINHLLAIKKDIVELVGGFRKGFEGSQDYDLILRCLRKIKEDEIGHIPKILYHWRAIKGSTALDPKEKPYTHKAGRKALQEFLDENKEKVLVIDGEYLNTYKPVYFIPGIEKKEHIKPFVNYSEFNKKVYNEIEGKTGNMAPLVSILIPTRDRYDLLKKCINSIREKTNYPNYEIIIINNQSKEEKTLEYFIKLQKEGVRIIEYDKEFNYADMHNFAMEYVKSEYVVFMNNDIEIISSNWLIEMMQHILKDEVAVVGAKLYYDDFTVQHGGVILGIGGVAGHSHKHFPKTHPGYFTRLKLIQNYSAVTAALMLTKKSVYNEIGGMDAENLSVAFNDIDYCLKVREKGYKVVWTPFAEAIHHESKSRGLEDTPEKQQRFQKEAEYMRKKWGNILYKDSYYNPNLTLERENFGLKV